MLAFWCRHGQTGYVSGQGLFLRFSLSLTVLDVLGGRCSVSDGNPKGKFALGLVQNEWKVYVKRPLDREEQDMYFLNITATDGLFVTRAVVEVTVIDTNDNSPVCDQVRTILFDLHPIVVPPYSLSLFLFSIGF